MRELAIRSAALALVCTVSCVAGGPGGRVANVPHLALEDTDGRTHFLSDYIGRKKTVVVTFWATWCIPCKDELPVLQEIYKREEENGLQVVAISMDGPETLARVGPFVRQMGLTFPVLLDTDSRAVALYNPKRAAPMLHIFDAEGRIVYSHTTFRRSQARALKRKIRAVLRGKRFRR
jgi:peroxiredoxin